MLLIYYHLLQLQMVTGLVLHPSGDFISVGEYFPEYWDVFGIKDTGWISNGTIV